MNSLFLCCFIFICCFSVAFSQGCNSTYANGLSFTCPSASQPYCVLTDSSDPNPQNWVYSCVACLSQCDCPINQFCSSKPGQVGTCQKFTQAGKSCLPLSNTQLTNPNITNSWKCALTYTDSNNNLFVDALGVCDNNKCQICTAFIQNTFRTCNPGSGLQPERSCGFSNELSATHSLFWLQPNTYYFPTATWWPIMFVFLIIILIIQLAICCFRFKGTDTSSKPKKRKTYRKT